MCLIEIPDDSLYCDQCRMQILRCSKCGTPGVSKFCAKCGGAMVFKELAPEPSSAGTAQSNPPENSPAQPAPSQTVRDYGVDTAVAWNQNAASAATVIMPAIGAKKLLLCHPDGWNMEVSGGDILGRSNGNHVDRLGAFAVISGTHAKIVCGNDQWFIVDLKSTNKTYVGNAQLQPDIPVQIKTNDIIQLANVKFIVREQ
jgi:hypothetical protein